MGLGLSSRTDSCRFITPYFRLKVISNVIAFRADETGFLEAKRFPISKLDLRLVRQRIGRRHMGNSWINAQPAEAKPR